MSEKIVVSGASLKCSMGTALAELFVHGESRSVGDSEKIIANLTNISLINIVTPNMMIRPPFGDCLGTLCDSGDPLPCRPDIPIYWTPASLKFRCSEGKPAVKESSITFCARGPGIIEIEDPGQNVLIDTARIQLNNIDGVWGILKGIH